MSGRLYRLLLRLYPADLREAHREEMLELFEHHRRQGRSFLLLRDYLSSLAVAHASGLQRRRRPRGSEALFSMAKDFAFAARNLKRSPAVSLLGAVALALGIGANTAVPFQLTSTNTTAVARWAQPGPCDNRSWRIKLERH